MNIRSAGLGFAGLVLLAASGGAQPPKPAFAVIEKAAGRVGFYTAEGQRAGEAKVGAFPHEGVLSPDGRLLYVSENGVLWMTEDKDGTNTIGIVDVAAMKKVGEISLGRFRRPHGVALDAATGRLYATTERPFGLVMVDTVTRKLVRDYDVKGKAPHMVTLLPGGEWAFVSNNDSDDVAVVNLKSGETTLIPTGSQPQGSVLGPGAARLYVTNMNGAAITVIDVAHRQVVGKIPVGKGPGRIAITPDGKTLIYNVRFDEAVGFADIATGKQVATVALGGQPLSLTMSRDGKLAYSTVQDQDKGFIISVAGRKILRTFTLPKGSGPDPVIPLPQP
jgi:YVTN family beta-propeller protein